MSARWFRALVPIAVIILAPPASGQSQAPAAPVRAVSAGPWSVYFEAGRSDLGDRSGPMLDAAAAGQGEGRALLLCYRLGSDARADMALIDSRLHTVARMLKERGAGRVFRGTHTLCDTIGRRSSRPEAGVEINAVAAFD